MAQAQEIRNPLVLRVLIYSFLVAPFGNIALTAISLDIKNWYYPNVFLNIISNVQDLDLAWLGLILVAGVLLTTRHRTAWLTSIFVLGLTILINIRNFISLMQSNYIVKTALMQTSVSLIVTLGAVGLFYYFRYPYLDRRTTLLGFAPRFDVHIPTQILDGDLAVECECQSISISGARLSMEDDSFNFKIGDELVIRFAASAEKLETTVIDYSDNILRLRFKELTSAQKGHLVQLAKDYHHGKNLNDLVKPAA